MSQYIPINIGGILRFALVTLLAVTIGLATGCGGGGGGGDSDAKASLKAEAGMDKVVDEQSLVLLDGTGSTGSITSYSWNQISGPPVSLNNNDAAISNFQAPTVQEPVVLAFRLSVSDGNGGNSIDDVNTTVNPVNAPPVAAAGSDQLFVLAQSVVILDGSQSSDSDGNIEGYSWIQTGGPSVSLNNSDTASPSFTAPTATSLLRFQLTVTDNEGAQDSDEVNINVTRVLFADDFSDGVADGWIEVQDSGNTADWRVISSEYTQYNNVEKQPGGLQESYHIGTYSYLASGVGASNYRFSVSLTPISNPDTNSDGNDVGVMFRFLNDANYYRLSLSSRYGFTRLEKKFNGNFTTLAVDSRGYYDDETLDIIVEVNGFLIQVFLNEEPLFGVIDYDLLSGTVALYCQDRAKFDDVLVTENSPAPSVVLSKPASYSVATTNDSLFPNSLTVSAVVLNSPDGGRVEFLLDGSDKIIRSDTPYIVQFFNVTRGEHAVDGVLMSSSGVELARDTNYTVGIQGDYYITIGDSITNGAFDDDQSDNTSADGRIIGRQGYQAKLNDLLTSTLNYPHIVFNEGIGGENSDEAVDRIDSILERHPESNRVLILLGTNDSGNGVSASTYRFWMEKLVNAVVADGKKAWVALIPPVFKPDGTPDTSRNNLIIGYNNVILNDLSIIEGVTVGPDFYSFFINKYFTHYADPIHPNGLGYAAMAEEWHDVLTNQ